MGVYRRKPRAVAAGERLLLKANRQLPDGALVLTDGRTLAPQFREFINGYAVTSHGSQGKTVDHVLFSDSMIRAATNDQQCYVTISRGRRSVHLYTADKDQLRQNVLRSGGRALAVELGNTTAATTEKHT